MANEILFSFVPGKSCYVLIFNDIGQIWNGNSQLFEAYNTSDYDNYAISATQQGAASPYYEATFPVAIPSGDYQISGKQQLGGSVAESDPSIAGGDFPWNGSTLAAISSLVTSGQISTFAPLRLARGIMVQNFPLYFKSNTDHITPLTSGIVSGQIVKDPVSGSVWGPLQSGSFTEQGNGFYSLRALTSGDMLGNTISLLFNAVGCSGGASDPLPMSFITQRVSGF